jgi:hypothetical protein
VQFYWPPAIVNIGNSLIMALPGLATMWPFVWMAPAFAIIFFCFSVCGAGIRKALGAEDSKSDNTFLDAVLLLSQFVAAYLSFTVITTLAGISFYGW